MKVRVFQLLALIMILSMFGCVSKKKFNELEKRVASNTARLDSLTKTPEVPWYANPYWNYIWFDLGKEYNQIVDGHFYVSSIKTSFRENGFEVTGIIANLDALAKTNVKVQCAIKDTSLAEKLTFGFSEVPVLAPGIKRNFSVFVPTKQTKISEIGVTIPEYH